MSESKQGKSSKFASMPNALPPPEFAKSLAHTMEFALCAGPLCHAVERAKLGLKVAIGQRIGQAMQGADLATFQDLADLQRLLTQDL